MKSGILSSIYVVVMIVMFGSPVLGEVFLPGTQPKEAGAKFGKIKTCKMCHSKTGAGEADPYFSWEGGMMAQAVRDPIYRATLTIANQDVDGVGEFCWRCHTPSGWLEGRSTPADGSQLKPEDVHGVRCDACHRLVDPVGDEAKKLVKDVPPGYGNAMMVVDPENNMHGPYGDGEGKKPHGVVKSEFHASGELCGVCHDVSNPLFAKDVKTQKPYAFGHVERTFSEWSLSAFANKGSEGTCQSCHYKVVEGGAKAARFKSKKRDYFVTHGAAGGSTWVQDAVAYIWKGEVNKDALDAGKRRAEALLKTAAKLDIRFEGKEKAVLRITNLTGHKLPTGYPEGRRMWVNAVFVDAGGKILKEIGAYGETDDTVNGKAVKGMTLLDPEGTTVYESLPAISKEQAKKTGKPAGPSFHFVLNDFIAKDNRIPPEGFVNSKFKEHLCEPIGATYADGQNFDDVELALPGGCAKVKVRLMYQSMSWEYLKFLVEENKTDDWGRKLYDAWKNTGKCPPTVIAEIEAEVNPSW